LTVGCGDGSAGSDEEDEAGNEVRSTDHPSPREWGVGPASRH
jgi:hypothetical protein